MEGNRLPEKAQKNMKNMKNSEEVRKGPKGSERVRKSAQEVFGLGLWWSHPGLSRVSTAPGEPCLLCRPGATGLGDMGWFRVRWTGLNWFECVDLVLIGFDLSLVWQENHSLHLALVFKLARVDMDCAAWEIVSLGASVNGMQQRLSQFCTH